jgi:hypothetical protein
MANADQSFDTLGEKLASLQAAKTSKKRLIVSLSLAIGFLAGFAMNNILIGVGAFALCAVILSILAYASNRHDHFLIRFDQQHFISNLKLSQKTAIFDGNNIYHFGLDKKIGRLPLGALVSALRSEGYRIVCFFDANIYFTLRDNGAFKRQNKRFSIRILQEVFDLREHEIYIVPKGVQADKFIVESLSHLPKSFAVTNDRFRDYEKEYEFLTKDNQWRKGVRLQKRELRLYQHKFKFPLIVK